MKWNKYKFILLLLINAFPFILKVIFYSAGAMVDLYLFLPIFTGLTLSEKTSTRQATTQPDLLFFPVLSAKRSVTTQLLFLPYLIKREPLLTQSMSSATTDIQ